MPRPRPFAPRALLDVVLLLAFGFLVAARIPALLAGLGVVSPALVTLVTQGSFLLAIWALMRWRRLSAAHIGLQRPVRLTPALFVALGLCALLLVLSLATETMGLHRDLSNFDALAGDAGLTLFAMLFYGLLSAGFYEEVLYRGYLMHRLADVFGRRRAGWVVGLLFQATIFGLSHLHQGAFGALYTGVLSVLIGAVYLLGIRNLWILVVAHGTYDALRILYFHLLLTYGGVETLAR